MSAPQSTPASHPYSWSGAQPAFQACVGRCWPGCELSEVRAEPPLVAPLGGALVADLLYFLLLYFPCEKKNVKLLVSQLCPVLCDPRDCSPPGSSVHEIL